MQVSAKKAESISALKTENYAAVLHGQNDLRFEPAPVLNELQHGTVRVRIKAVGICGTDIQLLKRVSHHFYTSQASVHVTLNRRFGLL